MKIFSRSVVAASLLAMLCACGSTSDDAGSPGGDDTSTNAPADQDQEDSASSSTVASVVFRRSGGLKPIEVNRVFSADQTPPKGYTEVDVEKVIGAAQKLVDAGVTIPDMPKDVCCDRFTYEVVVRFADGTATTYTTIDGLEQPPLLASLLGAVS